MAWNISLAPENTFLGTESWEKLLCYLSAAKEQKIDGSHYNPDKC